MPARRTIASLALGSFLLSAGCLNTDIPPYQAGADAGLESDEQRLWARSAEQEDTLDHSGFRAALPDCEAYLDHIVARLAPEPLPNGATYHVRILVDPTLNAFALPNGVVYVHTGILASLQNEAQLATVLGHELTHTTHRHGLKELRKTKNASAFMASFTVGTYGLGALIGGIGALASVSGYSRELEREADQGGFAHMVAAGYDPRECPKTFAILLADAKRSKIKEPFFFGSHPRLEERIASFNTLVESLPPDRREGDVDAADYNRKLLPAFRLDAEAALHANDFDQVQTVTARVLAQAPNDSAPRLLLAEALRKRDAAGDLKTARDTLQALARDVPDLAPVWRELGLVLMKSGDRAGARSSFTHYLELSPQAADRAYIQAFIQP